MPNIFIEASLPDGSFTVVWRGQSFADALEELRKNDSPHRLELWSDKHADSPKGFAPMALRYANARVVLISNTLKMLMHGEASNV